MSACEACWSKARERAASTQRGVNECYAEILAEMDANRCPLCGYTEHDKYAHMDHHLCKPAAKEGA